MCALRGAPYRCGEWSRQLGVVVRTLGLRALRGAA
jgi:hypothetical protein